MTDGEPIAKKRRTERDMTEPETKKSRREPEDPMQTPIAKALLRVDIAEGYSPIRVTGYVEKYGLKPGEAMDLTTGWDLSRKGDQERACKKTREEEPFIIIGSPQCTYFSVMQNSSLHTYKDNYTWMQDMRGGNEKSKRTCTSLHTVVHVAAQSRAPLPA